MKKYVIWPGSSVAVRRQPGSAPHADPPVDPYIHAPVDTVADILNRNPDLVGLLDNNWLSLLVVDPTQDDTAFRYQAGLDWELLDSTPTTKIPVATTD